MIALLFMMILLLCLIQHEHFLPPHTTYTPRYIATHWIELLKLPTRVIPTSMVKWVPSGEWMTQIQRRLNSVYGQDVIRLSGPFLQTKHRGETSHRSAPVYLFGITKTPKYSIRWWHRHSNSGGDTDSYHDGMYRLLLDGDRLFLAVGRKSDHKNFSEPPKSSDDPLDSKFYLSKFHDHDHSMYHYQKDLSRKYLPLYRRHRITQKLSRCVGSRSSHGHIPTHPHDCIISGGTWKHLPHHHRIGRIP